MTNNTLYGVEITPNGDQLTVEVPLRMTEAKLEGTCTSR